MRCWKNMANANQENKLARTGCEKINKGFYFGMMLNCFKISYNKVLFIINLSVKLINGTIVHGRICSLVNE